jgi:bifunctional DNA-binding transcriptional regulator/antitoxin component of YhaV-PrlF toxin-antitoxin module
VEEQMSEAIELRIAQRGVIVIPKSLREAYDLRPGVRMTLLDLGGTFVLSRQISQVDAVADRLAESLSERGESLEGMLRQLREERERYEP